MDGIKIDNIETLSNEGYDLDDIGKNLPYHILNRFLLMVSFTETHTLET
ncbi:hypothetical protein PL321_08935 [Caloramator sp. mosi_1]|nr:hypothetical protein [Caloramator sp. mosi_1]WDC85704.1 hypothetical protein PL321_08935 [Caloramator sp. mosi_1]